MSALDKRLLFVTGKGGVGKTTVAAAIGLLAARRGLRTIVAEVAGRHDVAAALGREQPGAAPIEAETPIAPGLFTISIDVEHATREYLGEQLPSRTLADALGSSRTFGYLAAAAPGLAELITVGKVWELSQDRRRTPGGQPYDLVVCDAPATGHGLALLRAPRTIAGVARVGPIHRQATTIADTLADTRHTGVVAVTTAEEMPVTETLVLLDELDEWALAAVVVNGLRPRRFTARDVAALASHHAEPAVGAALQAHGVAREQHAQLARLRRRLDEPPRRLPFAPTADTAGADVAELADRLEAAL